MREGPLVVTKRTCTGCKWLDSEGYRVQSDSGTDYWCMHPSLAAKERSEIYVGDTQTNTPDWCPVLPIESDQ